MAKQQSVGVADVGEVMRAAREKLGKTQAQMATDLEVTQPLIARWEAGNAYPRTEDVRRVAAAYRLKPDQLLPERAAS